MKDLLFILEKSAFYLLLVSMFAYAISNKRDLSILSSLVVVFLGEYFLDLMGPILSLWQDEMNTDMFRVVWYGLFTLTEIMVIHAILQIHKLYHLELSFGAKQTVHGYFGLAAIQISLCILSFFFPHHVIVNIHAVAVSSLFFLILATLFSCVVRDFLPWSFSLKLEKNHD